ncbi:tRNA (5-methylaminomethyl-2-thiouridine)(34)-methyltransferase MnmD [Robertkochia solimangrovi]|uniref:tRNA (5-methylaminomethyl-2-thiouridine)(34)-methyltransferase MnmD n=1 Tax=Robertkochia solimangrovi TaxID=2213046 RepID=UPI00117EB467|nr:tRNA (5-methylaminomethyl-2-thiouridine)(34)-methyltransferase MnmD [Robertkochia solimangrovi]TRZ43724.1 SAM-dependent methyltransferase [Robertkochia solimangrovi]
MKRKIIKTADGSSTIFIEEWNEHYHSKHGAIQEAYHVFIEMGLNPIKANFSDRPLRILEIGFGTGLNAIITLIEAKRSTLKIEYTGVEAFPVTREEWELLNYTDQLHAEKYAAAFKAMHEGVWETALELTPDFSLTKQQKDFTAIDDHEAYDLIYFDAFGARVQPELWGESVFKLMYDALDTHGVLVTYASKGSVRRAMLAVGFQTEKLPGPPGKREMLRAVKAP